MNTLAIQIFSLIGIAIYFILILYFLKIKSLALKYSLIWIAVGVVMLTIAVFPGLIMKFSKVVGIITPINALFAMLFFFTLLIMMTLTAIASKQGMRIMMLIQNSALLEKRIRELEEKLEDR